MDPQSRHSEYFLQTINDIVIYQQRIYSRMAEDPQRGSCKIKYLMCLFKRSCK